MGIPLEHNLVRGIIEYHHERGETVVEARGSFDGRLSPGQRDYLRRSRYLGGRKAVLLVNINSDLWIKMMKKKITLYKEWERAEYVADEDVVDYTVVYPGTDIHPALSLAFDARPDILTREDKDPEIIREELRIIAEWAKEGYAPEYHPLPRSDHPESTTDLEQRVQRKLTRDIAERRAREIFLKKNESGQDSH